MIRIARVAAGAQKELDIAKTEMVKIAKVATAAKRELDIAMGETRLLNKVINGLQQRLDELEGRWSVGKDHPPLESGSSDDGWGPGPGPGRAHAPGGAPTPLSAPPLTTARAAVTSACRPAVAVRSGVMSGSVRSTADTGTPATPRTSPRANPNGWQTLWWTQR